MCRMVNYMDSNSLNAITEYLSLKYPNPVPALKFKSEYQLLVAVMLSAQCTDARVNKVTAVLFEKYPTPQKMIELSQEQLEKYIFSCGLYHSKAKHILQATADILNKFDGQVPEDFNKLKSLAGVGQKTANVVWSVAFKRSAIAVDTHVFRVANRIGLAHANTPQKTEEQLKELLPENIWSNFHHYLIFYGREVCKAQKPLCEDCGLKQYCEYYNN